MTETDEYRCPACDSTDLVVIDTRAIADELMECRACLRLHQVEHGADGRVQLVPI